jgi:hypothetical protein
MRTRRIASGTPGHPTPRHVIKALLDRLIEENVHTAWAHFDVLPEGGWLRYLLISTVPWVEVGLADEQSLLLNLGKQKDYPPLPEKWPQDGNGLWTVPVTDIEELIEWADNYLVAASENRSYRVLGWIEGL